MSLSVIKAEHEEVDVIFCTSLVIEEADKEITSAMRQTPFTRKMILMTFLT